MYVHKGCAKSRSKQPLLWRAYGKRARAKYQLGLVSSGWSLCVPENTKYSPSLLPPPPQLLVQRAELETRFLSTSSHSPNQIPVPVCCGVAAGAVVLIVPTREGRARHGGRTAWLDAGRFGTWEEKLLKPLWLHTRSYLNAPVKTSKDPSLPRDACGSSRRETQQERAVLEGGLVQSGAVCRVQRSSVSRAAAFPSLRAHHRRALPSLQRTLLPPRSLYPALGDMELLWLPCVPAWRSSPLTAGAAVPQHGCVWRL